MNSFYSTFILMIIDPNVLHEEHEECSKICIIKSQNLSCSNNETAVKALFQFDINLPKNAYSFGKCRSCFNVTQINITCILDKTSMKYEPYSTKNKEITTAEIIYESHSTQNDEITTSKMIHEPHSTQNGELTTVDIISEPHSTQNGEITTTKLISRSSGKLFFCFDFVFLSLYLFCLISEKKCVMLVCK